MSPLPLILPTLLPELILFVGAILLLLSDIFFAKKTPYFPFFSHLCALLICCFASVAAVKNFSPIAEIEPISFVHNSMMFLVAKSAVLLALIFVILLSCRFVFTVEKFSSEFLALILIATCGGMIMLCANDFLSFYLGLELQALSSYLLAAFNTRSSNSSESGMKYFVLGSLASGLLLFGVSLVYGYSATTNFAEISKIFDKNPTELPVGLIFGMVLVIVAMLFKVSAAPFHMWTPDIYQGSPTATATFFASVGKMTAIFGLMNLLLSIGWKGFSSLIALVAILSIIVGSFAAIFQKNIKRLLAFSSVSHVGFILLAIAPLNRFSIASAVFYLLVYVSISLGCFGFLSMLKSSSGKSSDNEDNKIFAIESLAGLSKKNPIMAFAFSVLIFSTAGIPPLAGFFSKFFILSGAIGSGYISFAIVAVVFSVVSSFYYLRIIKIIYFDSPSNQMLLEDFGNSKFITFLAALLNIFLLFFIKNTTFAIENLINF
jgi:NADH-quinone oxidoreductase subunit N